jgi:hypothetical protein
MSDTLRLLLLFAVDMQTVLLDVDGSADEEKILAS